MHVIAIVDNISGIHKGMKYEVKGFSSLRNTVEVIGSFKSPMNLELDTQAVILVENSSRIRSGENEMYLSFIESVRSCGGNASSIASRNPSFEELCSGLGPN